MEAELNVSFQNGQYVQRTCAVYCVQPSADHVQCGFVEDRSEGENGTADSRIAAVRVRSVWLLTACAFCSVLCSQYC